MYAIRSYYENWRKSAFLTKPDNTLKTLKVICYRVKILFLEANMPLYSLLSFFFKSLYRSWIGFFISYILFCLTGLI